MFKAGLLPLTLDRPYSEVREVLKFVSMLKTEYFHLLHVLSPGENRKKALKKLEGIGSNLKNEGFDIVTDLQEGHPGKTISRVANGKDIDFIYMPANRHTFVHRVFLGSTAQDVLRLADRPTFVHKLRPRLEKDPIDKILFATDLGDAARRAEKYVSFLGTTASELFITHVGDRAADPFEEERRFKRVNDRLARLEEDLGGYYERVESRSFVGTPHKVIEREAESRESDIIIIGRFYTAGGMKVMGTTSGNITAKTKASVLLVP